MRWNFFFSKILVQYNSWLFLHKKKCHEKFQHENKPNYSNTAKSHADQNDDEDHA